MHSNLLKFYADRVRSKDIKFPLANVFAQIVFTIKVVSSDIETHFSCNKYTKNMYRARLRDDVVDASRVVSQTAGLRDSEELTNYDGSIDVRHGWTRTEDGLDDYTKKYVGGKVSREFVYDEQGNTRKYVGEITHVHYLKGASHYVFHVVYPDDDSEDLEEWEVKNHWLGYN